MERKTMPRIMALLLAVVLTCTSIFTVPIDVQAAANPTKITLSATKKTLCVGKNFSLKVKSVSPSGASKAVTYKSSNKKVATVNAKGKVSGIAEGKATITVTSKANKKVKAKCTVTVKKGVEVIQTASSMIMQKGKSINLRYDITPNKGVNKKLTFKSNKPKIVKVSKKGKLTAKKVGKAKITVKSADGGAKKVVKVTVKKNIKPVKLVTLDLSELALLKGGSETLHASVTPSNATQKKVYFVSSDTSVARVNNAGRVVAKGVGTAKIYAYAADSVANRAVCTVTVTEPTVTPIIEVPVTGVSLDRTSLELEEGAAAEQLKATITPADASYPAVTWESSDVSVATVENGLVTPIKAGKADITVTTADGGYKAVCSVTVKAKYVPVEKVILAPEMTLKAGETTEPLVMAVLPSNATNQAVVWESSDEDIATVSANGEVHAVKSGRATVTVTTVDGQKTATCSVIVEAGGAVSVTGIEVTPKTGDLVVGGQALQLNAEVTPSNATDKSVVWASSNPQVASVSRTGGLVSLLKKGTAIIYAESANGIRDWCEVTVRQPLMNVTMDQAALTLKEGGQSNLIATLNPLDADVESVEWTAGSNAVAIVTDNVAADGKAYALVQAKAVTQSPVNVTVTVRTADGGAYTAECAVTVEPVDVTGVKLAPGSAKLITGETMQFELIPQPGNAKIDPATVSWSGTNEYVTVDEKTGLVTAKAAGRATITATIPNVEPATATVTVVNAGGTEQPVHSITLDRQNLSLAVGADAATLTATTDPAGAEVTWESGDPSVATVAGGVVTPVGAGKTTIVAAAGGKVATCEVTVYKALTSVSDIEGKDTINVGSREELTVTLTPADATIGSVQWESSNEEAVTVVSDGQADAEGKIHAYVYAAKTGSSTITVTITAGDGTEVTKEFELTSTTDAIPVPLTGIYFVRDQLTLEPGETLKQPLKVLYTPDDTTEAPQITWSCKEGGTEGITVDDKGVVSVAENVQRGSAVIVATAVNEAGETLTAELTVIVGSVITNIEMDETMQMLLGEEKQLTPVITPENAPDKTVYWISTDPEVAEVDAEGVVTAKAVGETTIIAVTKDGGLQARCKVTVNRDTLDVEKITLDQEKLDVNLNEGQFELNATVDPAGAATSDLKLTWTATPEGVVEIVPSEDTLSAVVKLKDIGNKDSAVVTITAAAPNGVSAACEVTIHHRKKVEPELEENSLGDVVLCKYTLGKDADSYQITRDLGDGKEPLNYDILTSDIEHDYDWLMTQFKPENYDNNFLKKYWNKFDWDNLVSHSNILQGLLGNLMFKGEDIDVKVTSSTRITITIKKGGKTKEIFVDRIDHADGSDLVIIDGSRRITLTDIEIANENDVVTIDATADVLNGMKLQMIISRTSFVLKTDGSTTLKAEITEDGYTLIFNVPDMRKLMNLFDYDVDFEKIKIFAVYDAVKES